MSVTYVRGYCPAAIGTKNIISARDRTGSPSTTAHRHRQAAASRAWSMEHGSGVGRSGFGDANLVGARNGAPHTVR